MTEFLIRWASTTFAVLIASGVVPGITFENASSLIWAGLLLGVLNAVVRPAILLIGLPLIVVSFGLFIPLVNALLLYLVGGWIEGFHVNGFWAAFWGGIVISMVGWLVNGLFKTEGGVNVQVRTFSQEAPPVNPSQPGPLPGGIKRVEGRVIEPDEK